MEHGLWIMALEEKGWEEDRDYGTWIMQVSGKTTWIMAHGLWHLTKKVGKSCWGDYGTWHLKLVNAESGLRSSLSLKEEP